MLTNKKSEQKKTGNRNQNREMVNKYDDDDTNKKAKKAQADPSSIQNEILTLREYILKCPDISQNSVAIDTAIKALDNELKKINRDEKLRKMFASAAAENRGDQSMSGDDTMKNTCDNNQKDHIVTKNQTTVKSNNSNSKFDDDTFDMEWQDLGSSEANIGNPNNKPTVTSNNMIESFSSTASSDIIYNHSSPSLLGNTLSKQAISDMTQANIRISTPIAAIALAIHSALRSNILSFKCTGIPEETNNAFVAPIRELPPRKFLPDAWDEFATVRTLLDEQRVSLRYRKDDIGLVILKLTIQTRTNNLKTDGWSGTNSDNLEPMICIQFGPVNDREPSDILTIPLSQHVNLESLNTALLSDTARHGILPALHYKGLAFLMTQFCDQYDLGSIKEQVDDDLSTTHTTEATLLNERQPDLHGKDNNRIPNYRRHVDEHISANRMASPKNIHNPNVIVDRTDDVLCDRKRKEGDFANDKLVDITDSTLRYPTNNNEDYSGNLMGPNHPLFFRRNFSEEDWVDGGAGDFNNGSGDLVVPGGLGMRPRFDPFYPPGIGGRGVPPGLGRGRGRGRGGRSGMFPSGGDPNPDHQRPPNDLNNNHFM